MTDKPAGYFCYDRSNGRVTRCKIHADSDNVMAETRHCYEGDGRRLAKHPLTQFEFEHLSLDELERKYPWPVLSEVAP